MFAPLDHCNICVCIVSVTVGLILSSAVNGEHSCTRHMFYERGYLKTNTAASLPNVCPVSIRTVSSLSDWRLPDTRRLAQLFPLDGERGNFVRHVRNALFSWTNTTPFDAPAMLSAWSDDALIRILDLDPAVTKSSVFLDFVSGRRIPRGGATPLTHRYGGHQFGVWAGQLGDGRAHLLGEYFNWRGERWEVQLKGSGRTPYSREGDGRAIVRSSVREFLASEAMHFLGIPTSRCASLVISSDAVRRDLLYNGHISEEKTAVVMRLAPSWFRFGTTELLAKHGELELLTKVLDFVIETHFRAVISADGQSRYLQLFSEITTRTAEMIALWQSVGFVHGVCNTDNFSLLSITIDYGPFRFMDEFDPDLVSNLSDDEQRYCYSCQPEVGWYNLERLAEALSALLPTGDRKVLKMILSGYDRIYHLAHLNLFRKKIGLIRGSDDEDKTLVSSLLKIMKEVKSDFTLTFRQLADVSAMEIEDGAIDEKLWALSKLRRHAEFRAWAKAYRKRLEKYNIAEDVRRSAMRRTNPRYVLRNWMAEMTIEATEQNNFSVIRNLLRILHNPFELQEDAEHLGYADPPPSWASEIQISCSS